MMEAVKDKPHTVLPACKCKVYIIYDMFSRPKIVYLAIKYRLLHVICRLYSTARGLREVFAILQITFLEFRLALVTPENTQVSIYGHLVQEYVLRELLSHRP